MRATSPKKSGCALRGSISGNRSLTPPVSLSSICNTAICTGEITELKRKCSVTVHHWREADNRNDLDGLAARMAALDLVISVGNANVHLAGALGVPAWSLLPCHGGWRWLAGRSDTPWYASVRLFRQAAPGDWTALFLTVRQELLNRIGRVAESKSMRGDSRAALALPACWQNDK